MIWRLFGNGRAKPARPIQTERLLLRAPIREDYPAWADLRRTNHDFLQPWEPQWPRDHTAPRTFRRRLNWSEREDAAGRGKTYLIFLRGGRQMMIGGLTLSNIRGAPVGSGKLGYWLGENFARQGLMSEAVSAVTNHSFGTLDLKRIEAACLEENHASRALLERCGFRYEGIARAYLEVNGKTRDHLIYARIREDEDETTFAR